MSEIVGEHPRFISIEGTDGSGKGTQLRALEALLMTHVEVRTIAFPRYDSPTGRKVSEYLDPDSGLARSLSPYAASDLYIYDRKAADEEIRKWLEDGAVVLADRFTDSNKAHQGAKFSNTYERKRFYEWVTYREADEEEIVQPSLTFLLNVSPARAYENIALKAARSYTTRKRDAHEADSGHLASAHACYLELAEIYPERIKVIECMTERNALRSVEAIVNELGSMALKHLGF